MIECMHVFKRHLCPGTSLSTKMCTHASSHLKFYPPFPWGFSLILCPFPAKTMENRVRKYPSFCKKHGYFILHFLNILDYISEYTTIIDIKIVFNAWDNLVKYEYESITCMESYWRVLLTSQCRPWLKINPLFQKSMEFYSENTPFSGNRWYVEGIKKDFLSPWICELACGHIFVETGTREFLYFMYLNRM